MQIKDAPEKWKEANDSYKYHLEGQLILQFEAIVRLFFLYLSTGKLSSRAFKKNNSLGTAQ